MNFASKLFAAGALALGMSGAASAASLSLENASAANFVAFGTGNYKASCAGGSTTCYNPSGAEAKALTEDIYTYFLGDAFPGLVLNGASKIMVEFLGKEAGAVNTAFSLGGASSVTNALANIGKSYVFDQAGGTLDLTFKSSLGTVAGADGFVGTGGIAFSEIFTGKYGRDAIYAFFDDSGASDDRDWDDMVVRITVVPLPAGALLLGTALAGLGFARRRKSA